MPEGGRTSYEHEIEEKLKKLDAKINVPEIPDAQAIFERAEKKKNNIFSIRTVRYAAAARFPLRRKKHRRNTVRFRCFFLRLILPSRCHMQHT